MRVLNVSPGVVARIVFNAVEAHNEQVNKEPARSWDDLPGAVKEKLTNSVRRGLNGNFEPYFTTKIENAIMCSIVSTMREVF